MTRAAGKKATVQISFTGSNGTYIPADTAPVCPGERSEVSTTQAATITEGAATAAAEAAEVGADYNLPAGVPRQCMSMSPAISAPTRVSRRRRGCRERRGIFLPGTICRTLPITSGNKNHYITWATEVAGVSYASCIPLLEWERNGKSGHRRSGSRAGGRADPQQLRGAH